MAFETWRRMYGPGLSLFFGGLCVVFALSGQLVMELRGGAHEHDTGLDPRHLALFGAMSVVVLIGVRIWRKLRAQASGQRDFHRLLKSRLTGPRPAAVARGFSLLSPPRRLESGYSHTRASALPQRLTTRSSGSWSHSR